MRRVWLLATMLAVAVAAAACGRTPAPNADRGGAAGARAAAAAPPDSLRAVVESVLLAHQVAPGETLRVRLLGVVGPDGSWAADGVDVRRERGRIVVVPRVRRVPGSFFIQMVMPLDVTIPLALAPGSWSFEVHGRGAPRVERVDVRAGARRAPPAVRLEAGPAAAVEGGTMQTVQLRAEAADGWVAKVEIRGFGADPQAWRDPGTAQPENGALVASIGVLRPPRDSVRRIEARAVDGQGMMSAPVVLELPARAD